MALIAVDAVVDVVPLPAVVIVGLRFQVATRARKYFVVARIRMARRADAVGASVVRREPCVIECRAAPCRGRVTGGACLGESGRYVIGICCRVVFRGVARVAIGGRAREFAAHVALRALRGHVLSSKRELGGRVIE